MQSQRRWVNQSQPQTLVYATFLMYISAALTFIFFSDEVFYAIGFCYRSSTCINNVGILRLLMPAAYVGAAYLIANEKRAGYLLGVAVAFIPIAARLLFAFRTHSSPINMNNDVVGLLFDVALAALLLHTQSREYQKIWFK